MAVTGKGARTRRRIIMCAAQIIAERGVAQTSLADVVERARLTKGALYFHFGSREELLVGVETEYNADSRRLLAEAREEPDPARRLIWLSFALARRQMRDQLAIAHNRLMLARTGPPVAPLPTAFDWAVEVRALLVDALDNGGLVTRLSLEEAAELLDDCLVGVVTASHVERRTTPILERMRAMWQELLLPALVPDQGRRAELARFADEAADWVPAADVEDEAPQPLAGAVT